LFVQIRYYFGQLGAKEHQRLLHFRKRSFIDGHNDHIRRPRSTPAKLKTAVEGPIFQSPQEWRLIKTPAKQRA